MTIPKQFDRVACESLLNRFYRAGWLQGQQMVSPDSCGFNYSEAGTAVHLKLAKLAETARNDKSWLKRRLALLKFLWLLAWVRDRHLSPPRFTKQESEAWNNHVADYCLQYLKSKSTIKN